MDFPLLPVNSRWIWKDVIYFQFFRSHDRAAYGAPSATKGEVIPMCYFSDPEERGLGSARVEGTLPGIHPRCLPVGEGLHRQGERSMPGWWGQDCAL